MSSITTQPKEILPGLPDGGFDWEFASGWQHGFADGLLHHAYCDGVVLCHHMTVAIPKLPLRGYTSGYRDGWLCAKNLELPRGWSWKDVEKEYQEGGFPGSHSGDDF